jgi:plastocyanin
MPPSTSAPNPPGAQSADSQILISHMAYTVPTYVTPGQQLTIVNEGDPTHAVTADENNLFDIRVSGGGGIQPFTAPLTPGTLEIMLERH